MAKGPPGTPRGFQLLGEHGELMEELQFNLLDDQPALPSLQRMHRLIAQSPRAQSKFFLLMDDIADIYLMGMDQSFYGWHHVQQSFHQSSREDSFASTAIPSLGGYGIAELEPFESQERGFQHGHRKKYSIPRAQERDVIQLFKEKMKKCCKAFWHPCEMRCCVAQRLYNMKPPLSPQFKCINQSR